MRMFFMGAEREVTKAYNGKQGCMCGCKGTYAEPDTAAAKARVRKVMNFVGPMRPDRAGCPDQAGYAGEPFMDERYVYVQEGDRVTCVYFKA